MSPRRQFRLATVLRVAKLREQQRECELAAGLVADRDAEEMRRQAFVTYEQRPDEPVADRRVGDLRARAALGAVQARRDAADELVAVRGRWLDATRRRRLLEELESRHRAEAALAATRASQRALDDLARRRRVPA